MNLRVGQILCDKRSNSSNSSDSSSLSEEEFFFPKTNPLKHKTEFCKTYSLLGYCNYGHKCRFAHHRQELIVLPVSQAFRKKKCKGYWSNGCCPYGRRCQFGHANTTWEDSACLMGLEAWTAAEDDNAGSSKLLKMLR